MKIKVKLFASYREKVGRRELELDLTTRPSSLDVWQKLVAEFPPLRDVHGVLPLIAVNQKYVAPEAALSEGDEVAFFPPVSGG
jgi:molybdopterin converting factor subunit 1